MRARRRALSPLKRQQSTSIVTRNAGCREVNGLARCVKLKFVLGHDMVRRKGNFFGALNLKLITCERGNYFYNFAHFILCLINLILFFISSRDFKRYVLNDNAK